MKTCLPPDRELLTCKELADVLKRHVNYIYAMKSRGFIMPGGRASIYEAQEFLIRNPPPYSRECESMEK